jgi:hypothetical protein
MEFVAFKPAPCSSSSALHAFMAVGLLTPFFVFADSMLQPSPGKKHRAFQIRAESLSVQFAKFRGS